VLNVFNDPSFVDGYEDWYNTVGQKSDRLEKALLRRLLHQLPRSSCVLEVGCGTGHFTRWLAEQDLWAVGVDMSRPMLKDAWKRGKDAYVQADALYLPFADATFDVVALVTALEFIADPRRALAEAMRVARQGLLLGILNRQSWLGYQLKRSGEPIWNTARFYSPAELIELVRQVAGDHSLNIAWRTTLWPLWPGALPLPYGGFIGMSVMVDST
jgi:ubiquinone/menaquinone biosynthesis C-methylase UbiE